MILVAGLGLTGQSVLRYLQRQGHSGLAFDTRANFDSSQLAATFPTFEFATGELPPSWLDQIDQIVLSPGIAKSEPWVRRLVESGASLLGDIELFSRAVDQPVIAITGSNGKSTVTTMVSEVLQQAGFRVGMGGNIGTPALDLLAHDASEPSFNIFVLELSSFQLETTHSLSTVSAAILNISPDHMDRYRDLADYTQTKARILHSTNWAVLPSELSDLKSNIQGTFFGLQSPKGCHDYGVVLDQQRQAYLACGEQPLMAVEALAQPASHMQLNALATWALCQPLNLDPAILRHVLAHFEGLAYRTQTILKQDGVTWINDSKGTNVGATVTALHAFAVVAQQEGHLWLIAGGVGKGADFTELGEVVAQTNAKVVLFGRDAPLIAQSLTTDFVLVEDLPMAIDRVQSQVCAGDLVLFSPACASFDQFKSYVHRGACFTAWVKAAYELDSPVGND